MTRRLDNRNASPARRTCGRHARIASRLARGGASRVIAGSLRCHPHGEALAIVCSAAAIHRGYRVTVVLDRLDPRDVWCGKALISSLRAPGRWLAMIDASGLSRRGGGSRARAAMLRAAIARIDEVEAASHGVWPACIDMRT